jgi:mxaJ protein
MMKRSIPLLISLLCAGASNAMAQEAATPQTVQPALRVCSDPNNLPFSNRQQEGFENRLAELIAAELGARLEYAWMPQRRGFIRRTLGAGKCDLVLGVPADYDEVLTSTPYYRSTYVFVQRGGAGAVIASFDDPAPIRRLSMRLPSGASYKTFGATRCGTSTRLTLRPGASSMRWQTVRST